MSEKQFYCDKIFLNPYRAWKYLSEQKERRTSNWTTPLALSNWQALIGISKIKFLNIWRRLILDFFWPFWAWAVLKNYLQAKN